MIIYIVQHEGWQDRVFHPSGNGTLSLNLARTFWPDAEFIHPTDPRHFAHAN